MRIGGGGGGWSAITGNTYPIKTAAVAPSSASGMTAQEVEALLSYLDPSAVAEAGKAHTAAAKTLQTVADSLVTHAQALAGGWSGTAAQGSIAALQQLHQTAIQLAQASAQTGATLQWLGETILPFYKNWKAPSNGIVGTVESWFGHNPADQAAQQIMQRLNNRLSQANAGLPPSVSQNLPTIGKAGPPPATTGGIAPGGGAGAAAAGVGLSGGPRGGISPVGGSPGGVKGVRPGGAGVGGGGGLAAVPTGPGGPTPPPTHLAGLPPGGGPGPGVGTLPGGVPGGGGLPGGGVPGGGGIPGGGGPEPFGPVPLPGGGAAPAPGGEPGLGTEPPGAIGTFPGEPGVGGEPGAGVGGSGPGGGGLVGEDVGFSSGESAVMGSDGMIGTGPGMGGGMAEGEFGPGNTRATGFVGADDAATETGGGPPMSGGSGGRRRENERHRQAWMAQDADIWEGETATSPSLIGA